MKSGNDSTPQDGQPKPPPFERLLIPDAGKKRRKKKSKQPAVVIAKPPKPPETPEPAQEETGTHFDVDMSVQNLVHTSRGVSLILWSLSQKEDINWDCILSGLSKGLAVAADDVDATYFGSAGELAETLEPRILATLLKKKLKRLEADMQRPKSAPKDKPEDPKEAS